MTVKYLMPCPACAEKTAVEARQSGGTVTCQCGAPVEVPGLRELERLERIDEQPATAKPVWGLRQGLMFIGVVLMLGALGFAAVLLATRPKVTAADESTLAADIDRKVGELTLNQTFEFWQYVLRTQLHGGQTAQSLEREQQIAISKRWILGSLSASLLGLMILLTGLLTRPTQPAAEDSQTRSLVP